MIIIRSARTDDADLLAEFIVKLDHEAKYLLYEPGEREGSVNTVKSFLSRIEQDEKSMVLIALTENKKIIGFICGEVSGCKRFSHVMHINIGVLKAYQKKGWAEKLGEMLYAHAKKVGIFRYEALIVKQNVASTMLMNKFGFKLEGVKTNGIRINEKLYDLCLVSKVESL